MTLRSPLQPGINRRKPGATPRYGIARYVEAGQSATGLPGLDTSR